MEIRFVPSRGRHRETQVSQISVLLFVTSKKVKIYMIVFIYLGVKTFWNFNFCDHICIIYKQDGRKSYFCQYVHVAALCSVLEIIWFFFVLYNHLKKCKAAVFLLFSLSSVIKLFYPSQHIFSPILWLRWILKSCIDIPSTYHTTCTF